MAANTQKPIRNRHRQLRPPMQLVICQGGKRRWRWRLIFRPKPTAAPKISHTLPSSESRLVTRDPLEQLFLLSDSRKSVAGFLCNPKSRRKNRTQVFTELAIVEEGQ
jgi:hypothetical protein